MTEPRILSPRVVVVIDHAGQLVEYTTQTDNRDAVRWDMTRPRNNWPTAEVAPILWLTFIAWSALNRAGDFTGKFEDFNEVALSVSAVDVGGQPLEVAELEDGATVGPTQPAPEPDYSPS